MIITVWELCTAMRKFMVLPCEIHGIAILDLRQDLWYSCAESVIPMCGITGLDLSETDLWYCHVVSVVLLYFSCTQLDTLCTWVF